MSAARRYAVQYIEWSNGPGSKASARYFVFDAYTAADAIVQFEFQRKASALSVRPTKLPIGDYNEDEFKGYPE